MSSKKIHRLVTSGLVFGMALGTIVSPAIASPNTTTSQFQSIVDKVSSAKIIVIDSHNTQIIEVSDLTQNISEVLKKKNIDILDYRMSDNTSIPTDYHLKNKQNLFLYKSEVSGSSAIIKLKAPSLTQKTDSLYVGETKIEDGKDGKAIKTVINTSNLSTDKKINNQAKEKDSPNTSEEKLTILEKPKEKITYVGTKVRPVSEKEEVVDEQSSGSVDVDAQRDGMSVKEVEDATKLRKNADVLNTDNMSVQSKAVELLKKELGKPYVWGATGPDSFDCSGLVYFVYHDQLGKNIPRTALTQGLVSNNVDKKDIQPGDILWTSSHIGVYIGDGKVLHAANPIQGVRIDDVQWFFDNGFKIGRFS